MDRGVVKPGYKGDLNIIDFKNLTLRAPHSVRDLPADVTSISVITPPTVTEQVVADAAAHGIRNIWMQPGAESPSAVALCREKGINVIADGSCLLVVLGYHDH